MAPHSDSHRNHAEGHRRGSGELPVLDLNSAGPLPSAWLKRTPRFFQDRRRNSESIPIDSLSLLCHCPECGAPMTVRIWLRLADCWACGTSIELADLQDLTTSARRTARQPARAKEPVAAGASAPIARPRRGQFAGEPQPLTPSQRARQPARVPGARPRQRPTTQHPRAQHRPAPPSPPAVARARALRDWLRDMPAWLVSLLLHLAFLTLLGLLTLTQDEPVRHITLSTAVSRQVREGGRLHLPTDEDEPDFDLPLPDKDRPRTERQRRALILADQEARQIRLEADSQDPYLPPLSDVKRMIGSQDPQRTFAVRDPRVRIDMVRREGGTTLTEAAVARGLRWMARHQSSDGSWSLHRFGDSPQCRRRCSDQGNVVSDSAATSLCLLPFLGAGQTHLTGVYQDVVARGLRWLIENQDVNGDLRIDSRGQTGMYAHGQGAIVLCEAFAMTGDEMLRGPAQRSIDFIVEAQHPAGGWRYRPGESGDTSVLGWQIMALQSARAAGLDVPQETMELAGYYLDTVLASDNISYAYRPERAPTHVMTAEALLCRMYMGWTFDDPGVRAGVELLADRFPPSRGDTNIYYWYYATQVLHHAGGSSWKRWNLRLRDILVQTQEKGGHEAGSWQPNGPHAHAGGRIYMTALAVCTLEVYYRHAPIFRRLQLTVE